MTTATLLFSRRWWWKTLIVLLAMAVMAALGIWQLDRLEQRRAFNQQKQAALAAPPIELTDADLPASPQELRNRQAVVRGEYDTARQVAIKNQNLDSQPGVHLVTPLRIAGSDKAVLVNRGWLPFQQADPATWAQFDEQTDGPVQGILQPTRRRPDGSISILPEDTTTGWFRLDIDAIGQTLPYELLPVVLQLTPEPGRTPEELPRRIQPDIAISEGNHFSYALQWFSFAVIAGVVYIAIVRREEDLGSLAPQPPDRPSLAETR